MSIMTFHRDGKQIGMLDFNGPEMTFTGDADESAKVFFDFIARSFKARLDQERADERKVCSQTRAGKPRELKPVGCGTLLDEQQYCLTRAGVKALRLFAPPSEQGHPHETSPLHATR